MPRMSQQRIIWFAIVMSTAIYLVVALQLGPDASGPFDVSAGRSPVPILYGVALAVFLFGWFVAPRVVRSNAQTKMIVCLAIFEACAIFGLLAALLVRDWRLYLAPWALALTGFIRELPRASSRTAP
jgi:hypothetical protein